MEEIKNILSSELTGNELAFLIGFLKQKNFTIDEIKNNFGSDLARQYARILARKGHELAGHKAVERFFQLANQLHNESQSKSLIMSKNALTPVGMCDLKRVGVKYESPY